MKMRKTLAVLMAIAMVFCYMPLTAFADVTAETTGETSADVGGALVDMPNDGFWSTAALKAAVSNGLLNGFTEKDGTYIRPDDPLTRAQMAAIVNRAFGAQEKEALLGVGDVSASAWYYMDMQKAVKMGTMKLDSKMRPNDSITRQEAFTILGRALKMKGGTNADLSTFNDATQVANWAASGVGAMVKAGYIKGDNNLLTPTANMTRAQFAVIMNNVIKQYITASATVTEITSGNVMINAPDVTLKDVTITGDLILGDGVGEGTVTLKNVIVKGNLIARGGGVDSIIITGGSVEGKIIIAKIDGKIRVFAEDGAEIEVVEIDDGKDDVIIEGTVGTVEVTAPNTPIIVQNATVKKIDVKVEGAGNITVDSKSKVDSVVVGASSTGTKLNVAGTVTNLETSAPGTAVSGTGTVSNAKVNKGADNATITTPKTVIKNDGASGVKGGGGKDVPPNSTMTNDDLVVVPDGGLPQAGGGGGGGGGPTTPAVVAVSAISVNKTATVLLLRTPETLIATVSPSNASNKNVTWKSSDEAVATVDVNGVVTPVAKGEATITATSASDGSKTATTKVIVSDKKVVNTTQDYEGYDTIQAAINAATEGNTIKIAEGTYTEAFNFREDKDGNVKEAAKNLTLKAIGDVTITNPDPNTIEDAFTIASNMGAITIDGFKIKNFKNGISQGWSQRAETTLHVLNNEIWPSVNGVMRNGIQVSGDNSIVRGNTVHGAPFVDPWAATCIYVIDANNVTVEDNIVSYDAQAKIGICISSYKNKTVSNITVKNNTVNNAKNGVQIDAPWTSDGVVSNVIIENNQFSASSDETTNGINVQKVILEDSEFKDNSFTGFTLNTRISDSATISKILVDGKYIVNVNGLNQSYYAADETLEFTISGLGLNEVVTLGLNINQTPTIPEWVHGKKVLHNQTEGVHDDWIWTGTTDGNGVLTVSGTVEKELPAGSLYMTLGSYGNGIDNQIHLDVRVGVGYAVGEWGQAGWVFYDKGSYSDGWRYLEAAPASTEFMAPFNNDFSIMTVHDTSEEIGSGKNNTAIIVENLGDYNEGNYVAKLCDDLVSGGKSDWFLPSRYEAYAMYTNLYEEGIGDFTDETENYRTSSQYKTGNPSQDKFNVYTWKPSTYIIFKNGETPARAVRAF